MNTFYTILCIKHPLTKKYSIRHMILHVNLIIFTYTNLNVGLTTIKRFIFFHLLCRIICSRTFFGIWLFQPTQSELIYHLVRTFQSLNLRQLTFKELCCLPGTSTHIIVRGNCCLLNNIQNVLLEMQRLFFDV